MTTTIQPAPPPADPQAGDVWGFPAPVATRYWNPSGAGVSGAWTATDRWLPAVPPVIAGFSLGALFRPMGIWYREGIGETVVATPT